jgi:heat shock protein HslJ
MMRSTILTFAFLALLFTSCEENPPVDHRESISGSWLLVSFEGNGGAGTLDNPFVDAPLLTFTDNGIVRCQSTCNTGEGFYTVTRDSVEIRCGLTELACSAEDRLELEKAFRENLNLSKAYLLEEERLELVTSGNYNLRFIRIPPSESE